MCACVEGEGPLQGVVRECVGVEGEGPLWGVVREETVWVWNGKGLCEE